jgi:phasin family protein
MADQKTETHAAKADEPKKTEAAAAPAAVAKAAEAPTKAALKAAGAPARKARTAKPRKAKAPRAATRRSAPVAKTRTQTNRIQNEGTRTMKNEANKIADRFQTAFGDVNERAQSAIERNTRFAEELTELGRGNVEAFVASTKIVAKSLETVGQEVAEFGRKSFEDASQALRSFAEVKSPTDFFRLQSEFARSQFDGLVAETSKLSETMIKLAGDVAEPVASRYSATAERVKNAVAA